MLNYHWSIILKRTGNFVKNCKSNLLKFVVKLRRKITVSQKYGSYDFTWKNPTRTKFSVPPKNFSWSRGQTFFSPGSGFVSSEFSSSTGSSFLCHGMTSNEWSWNLTLVWIMREREYLRVRRRECACVGEQRSWERERLRNRERSKSKNNLPVGTSWDSLINVTPERQFCNQTTTPIDFYQHCW